MFRETVVYTVSPISVFSNVGPVYNVVFYSKLLRSASQITMLEILFLGIVHFDGKAMSRVLYSLRKQI